tara:strand:+ start:598 stop:1017 length:420 start_codon:yes stop_codon:yes gene_type:complete
MKIQVTPMHQKPIENYRQIIVSDNFINFSDLSDNECTEILAADVLDFFSFDKIAFCLESLVKKLRLNGTMVIGGKDIRLFSKAILHGAINEADGSRIVNEIQSMSSLNTVRPVLEHLGLEILSTQILGIHFEIKAKRGA